MREVIRQKLTGEMSPSTFLPVPFNPVQRRLCFASIMFDEHSFGKKYADVRLEVLDASLLGATS